MAPRETQFLRTWIIVFIGSFVFIALFNALIDPYIMLGMPRLQGFNARKPAADTKQRLMKAYDVFRTQPKTLILGSSRAAIGLDATSAAWTERDRPVYNLALGAGSPYMAYRYLQHVLLRQSVSTVVLGLELEYFLRNFHAQDYEFESHLLVAQDGSRRSSTWMRLRDVGHGLTGLNSLSDSIVTMTENWLKNSSDMRSGNWSWNALSVTRWNAYAQFTLSELQVAPLYDRHELDTRAFETLSKLLDLCESHQIRVIIFISPSHADLMEIMHLSGSWLAFEQWMRELTTVLSRYTQAERRNSPVLWDFTGYLPYTEESIAKQPRELTWFLNQDHYSKELGDLIIRRLRGVDGSQFGQMLTLENVESHIRDLDRQRQSYLEEYPSDVVRISKLYELATGHDLLPLP